MNVTYKLLVSVLLVGFLLGACAEKEVAMPEEMATEEMPMEEMASEEMPMEEMATEADEPGGYVPTQDELVPGEVR